MFNLNIYLDVFKKYNIKPKKYFKYKDDYIFYVDINDQKYDNYFIVDIYKKEIYIFDILSLNKNEVENIKNSIVNI